MTIAASDVIAVVAIVSTIAVAWIGHLDRKGDRENERTLAREAHEHKSTLVRETRLQRRRARAYREMLNMAFRIQAVVGQTMPILESVPPPPRLPMPTTDEQAAIGATVGSFGSPEVVAQFRVVIGLVRAFGDAVWLVNALRPDPSMPPPGNLDELHKAHLDVQHQRAALNAAVDELERVAREELAS